VGFAGDGLAGDDAADDEEAAAAAAAGFADEFGAEPAAVAGPADPKESVPAPGAPVPADGSCRSGANSAIAATGSKLSEPCAGES